MVSTASVEQGPLAKAYSLFVKLSELVSDGLGISPIRHIIEGWMLNRHHGVEGLADCLSTETGLTLMLRSFEARCVEDLPEARSRLSAPPL